MSDLMTRQAELEYESVLLGQSRYDKELAEQPESATHPGARLTRHSVKDLAEAIEQWIAAAADPTKTGRRHSALPFLNHITPEQAAYLTLRHAMDGAAGQSMVNAVAVALGTAIEDHVKLVSLEDDAPGLYRNVMDQIRKATRERHRNSVLQHVLRKHTPDNLTWSRTNKLHLGMLLIDLYVDRCGDVVKEHVGEGRNDTPIRLRFTEKARQWLDSCHGKERSWWPVHQPMIVPPRDWSSPTEGGYITRVIQRAFMVQQAVPSARRELQSHAMPEVYAAINTIQRTAWRINRPLLAIMQEARAAGGRHQPLFVVADRPLPVRPAGIPADAPFDTLSAQQREQLLVWRREAAVVHEFNTGQSSKRAAVAQKLHVATRFAGEAALFFPHYLDFRGRIYPYASYLNPQSDDLGRSLLEFAQGKPLGVRGLYWLKVHIANLFGVDKVSFADRVQWVNDHMRELNDSAARPLDGEMFWTTADSPWSALAACLELAGALVQGNDFHSYLPIAMDGSCSGLQHYSAMLRDPIGGAAVNLVPAEKPGDIYAEVARRAQALSDSCTYEITWSNAWRGKVVRKVAKQPTMTLCYSATLYGMQEQIEHAVSGLGGHDYLGVAVRPASVYMAKKVWEAIGETVVAAREAMEFLKECSRLSARAGLPIRWTAPSGFRVVQAYREWVGTRVDVHYKGVRQRLTVNEVGEKLDKKKQTAGVAPNFVHSCDSAHLMATVNLGALNGLTHWACIHDSFGVHAAAVDTLHACIRETFIEQYTPDVLQRFRDEIVAQLPAELAAQVPEVPPRGTLDLAAVRDARYFFA